jgi:hypothetical protein
MKIKTLRNLGLGLALVAGLANAAKADLIEQFTWVQGAPIPLYIAEGLTFVTDLNPIATSSGSLTYDVTHGIIESYSFNISIPALSYVATDVGVTPSGPGVGSIIPGGNLDLGHPPGVVFSLPGIGWWDDGNGLGPLDQNEFQLFPATYTGPGSGDVISGNWVTPVPEPTTYIAGALLMVPFGASTFRAMRRKQA